MQAPGTAIIVNVENHLACFDSKTDKNDRIADNISILIHFGAFLWWIVSKQEKFVLGTETMVILIVYICVVQIM